METLWTSLPQELTVNLLAGGIGRTHLTEIGYQCIKFSQTETDQRALYYRLACETMLAAWNHDPLNIQSAQLASSILGADALQSPTGKMLSRIAKESKPVNLAPQEQRIRRLIHRGLHDEAADILTSLLENNPEGIATLKLALEMQELCFEKPFRTLARRQLEKMDIEDMKPLQHFLEANMAFAQKRYDQAATKYIKTLNYGTFPEARVRLAECLLRTGLRDDAINEYAKDISDRPWYINSLLRTSELLEKSDQESCNPPGKVAILIYSYNKAKELNATLEAVFAARYENTFIAVLDNGSTDNTAAVINKWESISRRRGDLPMKRFDLHVNIGAPAARNWLLYHPQISKAEFAAFLDDDALPPTDWLQKLGAAINRYPDAGVWGCKVVDANSSHKLQSVDLHLKAGSKAKNELGYHYPQLRPTDIHHQTQDYGQFDYVRPCVSVTGCCHIMRMSDLEKIGGFDIRFSPSQFDDVDRDLRLCLQRMTPVYQGHLRVRHLKCSGTSGTVDKKSAALQLGNQLRLDMKYQLNDLQKIRTNDYETTLSDAMHKRKIVLDILKKQ
ncbi:glycosyltransferase [Maridesulfovibrio zosterae]|uniref:glycosyltransferase n=1 Tax=Maridesulfovibrio zosterae TaxID=82171 RepID=UPI00041A37A5|nr:glycosyltransferase [Maridesulfovibrio zosterae]